MMSRELLKDRFRGALLGGLVGDALGAPFKGAQDISQADLQFHLRNEGRLQYTAETVMTTVLADHLIDNGRVDGPTLAQAWLKGFQAEPWRSSSADMNRYIELMRVGVPWNEAPWFINSGEGSWGNGAAVRVAPIALLALHDAGQVVSLAQQSATITHTHRLGIEGAVLQAVALALLVQHVAESPLDVAAFLYQLRDAVGAVEYCQQLDVLHEFLPGGRWEYENAPRVLGCGSAAHESVCTALYSFLRHRNDYLDAVTFAMSHGGDTNTIASMTGALVGSYLGASAIPAAWLERVEGVGRVAEQADALLGLARSRMAITTEGA